MFWHMQVQLDCISEKEKDSKEFVKFLILHVLQKMKQFLKFQKEELLIQRIERF
jgi:hypothetical protein